LALVLLFNWRVLQNRVCPTKRALDAGDSARFSSIFLASSFSCSQAESTPTQRPVTQTVSPLRAKLYCRLIIQENVMFYFLVELKNLLELLRTLVNSKAELDKKYLDNFITPVWVSFEKSHKDYKASFEKYDNMLAEKDFRLRDFIDKVEQDEILSSDLRHELGNMIQNLPSSQMKVKADILAEFVNAIKDYFDYQNFLASKGFNLESKGVIFRSEKVEYTLQKSPSKFANFFIPKILGRTELNDYLLSNKKLSKKNIRIVIRYIMQEIQNRYDLVSKAYFLLKKELLT
jgi:hypothetical protein